ncbi:MAG TPA: GyrI-like domain-containing protein [Flavobacterium sp.]|nr:GyrI-like domain-containing protein [Flavobacterium sp.]
MKPRITFLSEKKLIGYKQNMNYAIYNPALVWQSFMPRKKEIMNAIGTDLFSVQLYPEYFWEKFNPTKDFEKWAAIEVTDFHTIPANMNTLVIPNGWYAVFDYKGDASDAADFFSSIFNTWLPNSDYLLDNRPHFEILGKKYKKDDPNSEEEIWIPIRSK